MGILLPVFKCFRSSLTALQTLSLSFLTTNSSSDSKAFLCFSGSPKVVHCAFLFFDERHGHSHKLTSSCALWYYTVGIPFCSSRKGQSQTSKFDGKTTIPGAPGHVITHYCYVRVTERYTETLHVKKMADLVAVSL